MSIKKELVSKQRKYGNLKTYTVYGKIKLSGKPIEIEVQAYFDSEAIEKANTENPECFFNHSCTIT